MNEKFDQYLHFQIEKCLIEILEENGLNINHNNFQIIENYFLNENLIIDEYQIGRIYTFSEVYFRFANKTTIYSGIIESIVSHDLIKR